MRRATNTVSPSQNFYFSRAFHVLDTNRRNTEKRSRKLAFLLRHDRLAPFETGGWLQTEYIESKGFTVNEIKSIVNHDQKHRFEISKDCKMVRARYGHSIVEVDLNYVATPPPDFLYHGSTKAVLDSIADEGILPRSRQYVHLTSNRKASADTGARHGKPASVLEAACKMYANGYEFYHVTKDIWLTKHVPSKYCIIQHSNIDL